MYKKLKLLIFVFLAILSSCSKDVSKSTIFVVNVTAKNGNKLLTKEVVYCIPNRYIAPSEVQYYARYCDTTDSYGIAKFEIPGYVIQRGGKGNDYRTFFALCDGERLYCTELQEQNIKPYSGELYYNLEINKTE
jgi:hypothetical protein